MNTSLAKVAEITYREFQKICPELRADPRTSISLKPKSPKRLVGTGKYVHFRREDYIRQARGSTIIILHLDGISLFNGSCQQL